MTGWSFPATEPLLIPSGRRAAGRLRVPASKSVTHRYLNLALLARRPVVVERPLLADDTRLFLAALARCGWTVTERPGEEFQLTPGTALAGGALIDCGNAGTLLRFLTAALAVTPGHWTLDGTARLRERPIGPLVAALRRLGAVIHHTGRAGCVPIDVAGGSMQGGTTRLDAGESSQYLSALLMAALAAPAPIEIQVDALTSEPYVHVTLAAIERCGGTIAVQGGGDQPVCYRVRPGLALPPRLRVEGDASAACYPAAAAALTGGSVLLEGLPADSPQGDRRFLDLLASMGAKVTWRQDAVEVHGDRLQAVDVDLSAMPDQVPTLAALAPFARGTTHIRGVAHLRLKESDRLAAMATELRRLGVAVEEGADRLAIEGCWSDAPPPADPVAVQTYGDHRIAMSLALVGLRRPGVSVATPEVVSKSYPAFWQDFSHLLGG